MGNTKLDPRSLTSEERAWCDAIAVALCSSGSYSAAGAINEAVTLGLPERRAIFGEPASEGGKVEYLCPYCGVATDGPTHLRKLEHGAEWTCNRRCSNCHAPSGDHELCERCESILKRQPAQPESVAAEMPEAVREAARILRVASKGYVGFTVSFLNSKADALESFWRTHAAQPAKARMTEELERVLDAAEIAEEQARVAWVIQTPRSRTLKAAIAAVRAQAAEAGKVRLPKVREGISLLIWKIDNAQGAIAVEHYSGMLRSMMAELDAAEGKVAG
mgnify:CR=1 FL=1